MAVLPGFASGSQGIPFASFVISQGSDPKASVAVAFICAPVSVASALLPEKSVPQGGSLLTISGMEQPVSPPLLPPN